MMIDGCFCNLPSLVQIQRKLERTEANLNKLFLSFRGGKA